MLWQFWVSLTVPSVISILSLIFSCYVYLKSRMRISIMPHAFFYDANDKAYKLSMTLINKSNEPITIYKIELKSPQEVYNGTNDQFGHGAFYENIYSSVSIPPYGTVRTLLRFHSETYDDTIDTLKLHTTKRKITIPVSFTTTEHDNRNNQ